MTAEPRVEDLLATIRKAIDQDISELDKRGAVAKAQDQRGDADQDIAQLRGRVGRQKLEAPQAPVVPRPFASVAPKLEPRSTGVGAILSGKELSAALRPAPILRPSYAEEPTQPRIRPQRPPIERMPAPRFLPVIEPYEVEPAAAPPQPAYTQAPHDVAWVEEAVQQREQAYYPVPQNQALMSAESAYAAQASFQALSNSLMAQLSGNGQLENMAREMLGPLLKNWLDDHLPPLVEKLVREEIERVARRGR